MISNEQIQALKAAAQLIAHGYQQEWGTERNEDGESTWVGTFDHDGVLCPFIDVSISEWSGEDGDDTRLADFIAKANPSVILSLLAEREADKKTISAQHTQLVEERRELMWKINQLEDALQARTLTVNLPLESLPKTEAFWSVMYDLMYQTKRKPHENWNVSLAFSEAKELAAYLNEVMPFRDAAGITLVVGGE